MNRHMSFLSAYRKLVRDTRALIGQRSGASPRFIMACCRLGPFLERAGVVPSTEQ